MTDALRPWFKHPVLLVVGALVVAASGCGSGTPTAATTSGSTTAAPVTAGTPVTAAPTTTSERYAGAAQDDAFADALTRGGIPFNGTQDAMVIGRTVCVYLGQAGTTHTDAAQGLVGWRPSLTPDQANYIVEQALQIYTDCAKPW